VVVRLKTATGDSELEIALLTSLPQTVVIAEYVAQLYRRGWSIETLFQTLTKNLDGDFLPWVIPKLNNFIWGLKKVYYNILVVVRRALGSVQGVGKIESHLSELYES
jgi:IS4 transposase